MSDPLLSKRPINRCDELVLDQSPTLSRPILVHVLSPVAETDERCPRNVANRFSCVMPPLNDITDAKGVT
jgi:hypothetical protein